ncbi:MAG: isopentenyl-diphosphate Delta-isomerase [Patescibacteria group bacterium]|nr:isopentenyl-diphosphate Delta-isomerase [Patescibacteria group bacterium]
MNKANSQDQDLDQVTLVDEKDRVVGKMDKIEAHRGKGKLHRAVSVFLFNEKGEVLAQKRSEFKIVAAHKWANTACGNVRPTENYKQCAKRRLNEELGIKGVKLKFIKKFQYSTQFDNGFSEKEIDSVFAGTSGSELKPNPEEVEDFAWIDFKTMLIKANQEDWAPWVEIIFKQKEIKRTLNKYAKS